MDGFYNSQLAEQLRAPECAGPDANPARHLVTTAVKKDGRDNTTALVDGIEQQRETVIPAGAIVRLETAANSKA